MPTQNSDGYMQMSKESQLKVHVPAAKNSEWNCAKKPSKSIATHAVSSANTAKNGNARTCKHTPEQALSAAKRRSRAANARGYHGGKKPPFRSLHHAEHVVEMAYGVGREHVALARRVECRLKCRDLLARKLAFGIVRRRIDFQGHPCQPCRRAPLAR